MKNRNIFKRGLATLLAVFMAVAPIMSVHATQVAVKTSNYVISNLSSARTALEALAKSQSITACIYLKEVYTVREEADAYSKSIATLQSGQTVNIISVDADAGRNIWYRVSFDAGGTIYYGYAEREFVACADSRFLSWADKYITTLKREEVSNSVDTSDIEAFPESYRDALYELKKAHPEWIFVKFNTNLDWKSSVAAEGAGDRSLVYTRNNPTSYKEAPYGDGIWSYASDGVISYYMDPRNFLTETQIFQFELLGYNSTYHSVNSVQKILDGTFMAGNVEGTSTSYAQTFMNLGATYKLSPLLQAARVYSEQGSKGSLMISGTYAGYEGLYNYYNIGASGATQAIILQNGLTYARQQGWTTRLNALEGGAKFLSNYYISRGQDNYYFQKWNVSSTYYSPYTHQYMQDISAAYKNSNSTYKGYERSGLLTKTPFVFKIPVYNNMPSSKQLKPDATDVLTINMDVVENLPVDQSAVLISYINGGENTSYDVTYSSSATGVATVNENGVITGVKPGNATITAKVDNVGTVSCNVNVIKADIAVDDIEKPDIEVTYNPNRTLADIELPEYFAWTDSTTVPSVTNEGYTVSYTPDESKYNSITMTLDVNVAKATVDISEIEIPEELTASVGTELNSIALPDHYMWKNVNEAVPSRAGVYSYPAYYCLDTENYEITEGILVSVNVKCTEHKWSDWSEPAGRVITRHCLNCDEEETLEIEEKVEEKDCLTEGHELVDGKCTRCGYEEPVINEHTHSYTESDISATCTEAGVRTFTCSCGDSYTEELAAKGHNYENGVCTVCGDKLPVVATPTSEPTPTPTSAPTPTTTSEPAPTPTSAPSPTVAVTPTSAPSPTVAATPTTAVPQITKLVTPTPTATPTSVPSPTVAVTPTTAVPQITKLVTTTPTVVVTPTTAVPQITKLVMPTPTAKPTGAPSPTVAKDTQSNATPTEASVVMPTVAPVVAPQVTTGVATVNNNTTNQANPTATVEQELSPVPQDGIEELPNSETDSAKDSKAENSKPVKVAIELIDTTRLTGDSFTGVALNGGVVEVVMNDGVVWEINLAGVDVSTINVDMNVIVGEADIPQGTLDTLKTDDVVLMTLSHEGEFGFEAVLKLDMGEERTGKYANLYYYNPKTDDFELMDSVQVDSEGLAAFNMKHASEYAITFSDKQQIVKKGSNIMLIALLIAIMTVGVVTLGFVLFLRLRTNSNEDNYFDFEDDSFN